jgi:RNA polymerase sigma-70 factor (ECF subfamily)
VHDSSGAEDIVQEAWLRFDEASRQQLVTQPLSYLYRIVRNLALDGRRRSVREGRIFPGSDIDAAAEAASSQGRTPEAEALYREQLHLLSEALDDLPERTRIAFEMHRFAGSKLREIAEFLDISVPFAQALVAEAVRHCRKRLGWP